MRTIIIITLLALSGCAGVSVGTYAGYDVRPQGTDDPVGVFEVQAHMTDNTSCKYQHLSDITRGFPFNDKPERFTYDFVGCGYEWHFKL